MPLVQSGVTQHHPLNVYSRLSDKDIENNFLNFPAFSSKNDIAIVSNL